MEFCKDKLYLDPIECINSTRLKPKGYRIKGDSSKDSEKIRVLKSLPNLSIKPIQTSKSQSKYKEKPLLGSVIIQNWGKVCVGQNNENLQIIASEPPELIAQCVHDMQVIQEKKPVKILLPIKPTEIGQTQEVELKGREKDPNCGENIDTLFFSKAYETNMTNIPKFENLNVEKNEVTCKKKKKPKKILAIENEEMKVLVDKNFNKKNQTVVETKMNVYGIEKPCWNELNEAIKTTKMLKI